MTMEWLLILSIFFLTWLLIRGIQELPYKLIITLLDENDEFRQVTTDLLDNFLDIKFKKQINFPECHPDVEANIISLQMGSDGELLEDFEEQRIYSKFMSSDINPDEISFYYIDPDNMTEIIPLPPDEPGGNKATL